MQHSKSVSEYFNLKKLKQGLKKYEQEILAALNADLGKSEFEAFTSEVGLAQKEISFHIRKLKPGQNLKKFQLRFLHFRQPATFINNLLEKF